MITRRRFGKAILGGAGVLAGSKLITPGRVRAQSDEDMLALIIEQTASRMGDYAYNIANLGADPLEIDLYEVASAAFAMVGIARQYGLDQTLESLYGIDGDATQAVDWAWQEGGWNQYWALAMVGIIGPTAEWFQRHPEWGSFERYMTAWPTDTWIYDSGPLSSRLPGVAGWANVTFWPASFRVGPGRCLPEDDGECATGGFKDYPYYDIYNPFMPRVPIDTTVIWYPLTKVDRCNFFKYSAVAIGGVLLVMSSRWKKFPGYKTAVEYIGYITGVAAMAYCGG